MALIAQADAPGLGACLDAFHYYNGPSKFEDLAYLTPENLFWVQVSDVGGVPREQAADGDRVLPGDGDYQLAPIIGHLRQIGYEGPVSLELLNPQLWRVTPEQLAVLARAAIDRLIEKAPQG
jgi:2-keto-myo-inositol isomerase